MVHAQSITGNNWQQYTTHCGRLWHSHVALGTRKRQCIVAKYTPLRSYAGWKRMSNTDCSMLPVSVSHSKSHIQPAENSANKLGAQPTGAEAGAGD